MDVAPSTDLPPHVSAPAIDQSPNSSESNNTHANNQSSDPPPGTKRRWRRNRVACDTCHARRVRCDRAFPCSRCLRSDIRCEFTRERRKRGRIARARLPPTTSALPDHANPPIASSEDHTKRTVNGFHNIVTLPLNNTPTSDRNLPTTAGAAAPPSSTPALAPVEHLTSLHPLPPPPLPRPNPPTETAPSPLQHASPSSSFQHRSPATMLSAPSVDERPSIRDVPPASTARRPTIGRNLTEEWLAGSNLSPESYSYDLLGGAGWNEGPLQRPLDILNGVDITGPNGIRRTGSLSGIGAPPPLASSAVGPPSSLKYPVLQPLMPFLELYLPRRLVFDLLELYFTSAFSTHMHPVCHHIHCYVLRKASFLSRDAPRRSSPALLASMLWVAALDDRAFALSISPPQRKKICQFLCALTIRLLRPLIHVSFKGQEGMAGENAYASPTPGHDFAAPSMQPFETGGGDDRGLVGPAGSLDDVITYIHVASIISASEQKAASMRWWHAAFTLARELKLNQEIEVISSASPQADSSTRGFDYTMWMNGQSQDHLDYSLPSRPTLNCICDQTPDSPSALTEEHREERRRTWWLLYIMDRHLALCYNRPLALLDAESEDLLLPLDEGSWQAGNVHSNSPKPDGPQCPVSGDKNKRRVFPNFICHDHSIFGFFLPLMTITGELIDLNQARNHPMLGLRLQGKEAWDMHVGEVLRQLEIYKASLGTFATHATEVDGGFPPPPYPAPKTTPRHPTATSTTTATTSGTTATAPGAPNIPPPGVLPPDPAVPGAVGASIPPSYSWHTQTVLAYASYLVHVLHILLAGKWDPVSLIEDKDFWTSSPTFASTISHALDAADSVEQILHYDPDISFMPYFFGIQLLQGSFLLLLIVERLQKEAGEGILNACEVMIRATESCVVTLNTEYQRNFRQVMRSAVAQARGRPVNHSEIRHRRKAVLALYRWTRKGTGLAL